MRIEGLLHCLPPQAVSSFYNQKLNQQMTNIEPKEVPLIKVLTVKKKHLQGLRESRITAETNFASLTFLGYITEWDAVLAKRSDNGHLVVFQANAYYMSREKNKEVKDWRAEHQAAQEEIHNLPQLFLD